MPRQLWIRGDGIGTFQVVKCGLLVCTSKEKDQLYWTCGSVEWDMQRGWWEADRARGTIVQGDHLAWKVIEHVQRAYPKARVRLKRMGI